MKYKIKRIVSQEKKREIIVLFLCVMLYFLCFVLSEAYDNYVFPDWLFEMYKNI